MSEKMVKCRYKYCHRKHETNELSVEDAVSTGKGMYWHKDCYAECENIKEIIDLWTDRVDPSPIFSQLKKVINQIVYDRNVESAYLLFALKYCINHGWKLRYPSGLHYVYKNEEAKQAWLQYKREEAIRNMTDQQFVVNEQEDEATNFEYKGSKRGFTRIINEGA